MPLINQQIYSSLQVLDYIYKKFKLGNFFMQHYLNIFALTLSALLSETISQVYMYFNSLQDFIIRITN